MDQGHHISTRPVSSFFMSEPVNPSPFGSSSLSTASPYSSFFGSASSSSKSQTISFPSHSSSPFGSSASSSFSSCSSFPSSSSTTSSSFFSNDQSFSNGSNSFSSAPFSSVSPLISPFGSNSANCSVAGFASSSSSSSSGASSTSSNSSTSPTSSSTTRLKHWKGRDHVKDSPANMLKNRRDEFVAKFRGIDLSDDYEGEDPGANDPEWSWDAMCNQQWDLSKSAPKETIPWYVFDDSLTWDEFLELSERDRIASGKCKPPPSPPRNEIMKDIDDDSIDEKEADPWLVKTEILIEPLININDPHTMLCAYCKQYALQKTATTKLTCSNCDYYHTINLGVTINLLKQRMLESLNQHKANCSANFSSYTVSSGDIILVCETCDKIYNIFKD
ncbi:uncharacterized protein LOC128390909 [Panonychus citri]|uniref:uncharacterized protein LOC128390909 n=1 Tax=Panonychus citri TaxID=50023 RepID=UPI002306E3E5|nr:uncharacterized protein LOC128390909 [Panonychus citri]